MPNVLLSMLPVITFTIRSYTDDVQIDVLDTYAIQTVTQFKYLVQDYKLEPTTLKGATYDIQQRDGRMVLRQRVRGGTRPFLTKATECLMGVIYDQQWTSYMIRASIVFNQRQKYLYTFYATNKAKVNTICRNACTGVYAFDSTTECLFVYVVCREIE